MGYSTSHVTGNAVDKVDDDIRLVPFALKKTRSFMRSCSPLEKILRGLVAPVVFSYYALAAPHRYKIDNKYIEGTPEYKKQNRENKVYSTPWGHEIEV
jgi:hypothetical protein